MYDEDEWELGSRDRHRLERRSKQRKSKKQSPRREEPTDGPAATGVVLEVNARSATVVQADGTSTLATLAGRLHRDTALCVGDDVTMRLGEAGAVITRVGRRRTLLVRVDPHARHREQMVVANVDAIGIVSAASDPPLRPRLIDRYLVAIERSGAEPVIVVNKLDEADPERRAELDALLAPYRTLGVVLHLVSASTGEGLAALLETLEGRRAALVGHSGVGKSSLVAAMGAEARAGRLADHGRGRHTTSGATLHRIGTTELIDTPGVRQFGLPDLTRRQLAQAFADFDPFAADCAFASCGHHDEPDCGVRRAAGDGRLSPARYDSYLRLLAQAR